MQALLDIILPVFLVIGVGYIATWRGWITDVAIDGLMKFAQSFAIPALLFSAIAKLDLGQDFDPVMLASFYGGALAGFAAGLFGARYLFGRPWEDSVAIGFIGLFSNTVLLGLPIAERAYGADALSGNYAIIALHPPFCYGLGITIMEVVRGKGGGVLQTSKTVLRAMFKNALIIGIALGFVVNLTAVPLPTVAWSALELITRAALPVALFALGGVLFRYRPEGEMRVILYICAVSLVLHPFITYSLGHSYDLPQDSLRSASLTAAMAPGINAYLFANMYGVAKRVAASAVLIGTGLTVVSTWIWLGIIG